MVFTESEPVVAQTCCPPRLAKPGHMGVREDQDPLVGVEVDGGEVICLQPVAGDRHRVRHDVHACRSATSGIRSASEIALYCDLVRIAEDRLGHGRTMSMSNPSNWPSIGFR